MYNLQALRDVILEKNSDKITPLDPEPLLGTSVANVICSLLYGDRYEYNDAEFLQLLEVCNLM